MASPKLLRPAVAARGYLHRRDAADAGWRPDAVRKAVKAEGLGTIGRSWIVAPTLSPACAHAADLGGWMTCVSAAEARGWWRPGHDDLPHIALPRSARRKPEGVHAHWSVGVVPRSSRDLLDPIENVLQIVSTCLPHEDALAVWESALRTGAVTREGLRSVRWRGAVALGLCEEATALSDSGLESLCGFRLRRGGIALVQQAVIEGQPVDILIGARLVVQIDGYAHHADPRQRRRDIAHDRRLRMLGYTVLRYDYHEVVNEWPRVEAEIRAAMVHGLHLAR